MDDVMKIALERMPEPITDTAEPIVESAAQSVGATPPTISISAH
jgi:hypothetical protein